MTIRPYIAVCLTIKVNLWSRGADRYARPDNVCVS